jgi:hypothetical protein
MPADLRVWRVVRQPPARGEPDPRSPSLKGAQPMKFVEPSHFTDPDAAARKLLEIANATEPAQDGRIYIELVDAAFLKAGGTAEQFRDGIKRAVDKGWMVRHESGTYGEIGEFRVFLLRRVPALRC